MRRLTHLQPFLRSRTLALTVGVSMLAVGAAAAAPGELPETGDSEVSEIDGDAPGAVLPDQASERADEALDSAGDDAPEIEALEADDDLGEEENEGNGPEQRSQVAKDVHAAKEKAIGEGLEGSEFGHAVAEAASGGRSTTGQEKAAAARERGADEIEGDSESDETVEELDVPTGPAHETPVGPPDEVPPVDTPVGPPAEVPPVDTTPEDVPNGG